MIVRKLILRNFMRYREAEVEFPAKGLVIVTGRNGRGKSALAEAVATAAWGETLRGTPPWRPGEEGTVELWTEAHRITRKATRSAKKTVEWIRRLDGKPPVHFATMTKADEALASEIGSFDLWRKTSIFSSRDAARFSESTDAQRKLLLENILGLSRFDEGLAIVREAKRKAEADHTTARMAATDQERWVQDREHQLERLRANLEAAEETIDVEIEELRVAKLSRLEDQAIANEEQAAESLRVARSAGFDLRRDLQEVERDLETLADGKCPTCGQEVGEDILEPLRQRAEEIRPRHQEIVARANQDQERLSEQLAALRQESRRLRDEAAQIKARIETAGLRARARETAEDSISRVEAELVAFQVDLAAASAKVATVAHRVAVLECAERVLGVRGVRAAILGRTLDGLATVANSFLKRMVSEDAKIVLRPYSERKGGAVVDAISLDIEGWGGGYGYKADSDGQRRRVDLAFLFGLATLADAALGRIPGDLWFDEVFDGIDEEGVAAVSEIIHEISKDRKVTVISHNLALVEHLREHAEVHFEVTDTDEDASEIRRYA